MKRAIAITLLCLATATGAVADTAIIVNPNNAAPPDQTLGDMLTGKKKYWDGGSEVVIAVIKDESAADTALRELTGMNASRFKSHWQRLAFTGRGRMPKTFDDVQELIAFVKQNAGAIGIVPDDADITSVTKVK